MILAIGVCKIRIGYRPWHIGSIELDLRSRVKGCYLDCGEIEGSHRMRYAEKVGILSQPWRVWACTGGDGNEEQDVALNGLKCKMNTKLFSHILFDVLYNSI